MSGIELSRYIDGLRKELMKAVESGSEAQLRFFLDKIELEIQVSVQTTVTPSGEVSFSFLVFDATVGAEAARASTTQQTLKLSLIPGYKGSTGNGVYIAATGGHLVG